MTNEQAHNLGMEDLAWVLDGSPDCVSEQGTEVLNHVLREWASERGRFDEQIATLKAMEEVAGCGCFMGAVRVHQELDQLLAADGWEHPAEVLEDDAVDIRYAELIRVAEHRARETDDPSPILDAVRRLETAHAANDVVLAEMAAVHDFENRLSGFLLGLEPEAAEKRLQWLVSTYRRRRAAEEADARRSGAGS